MGCGACSLVVLFLFIIMVISLKGTLAFEDPTAADVSYDNAVSGLTATDVQAAIDELAAGGGGGSLQDAYNAGSSIAVTGSVPVEITAPAALDQTYLDVLAAPGNPLLRLTNEAAGSVKPCASIFSAQSQGGSGGYNLQVGSGARANGTGDTALGEGCTTNANSVNGSLLGHSNSITGVSSNVEIVGASGTAASCVGHLMLHDGDGGGSTMDTVTGGISQGSQKFMKYRNGGGAGSYPWNNAPGTTVKFNELTWVEDYSLAGGAAIFTALSIPFQTNEFIALKFKFYAFTNVVSTGFSRYNFGRGRYFGSNISGVSSVSAIFDNFSYNPGTAACSLTVDVSGGNLRVRLAQGAVAGQVHLKVTYNRIKANL